MTRSLRLLRNLAVLLGLAVVAIIAFAAGGTRVRTEVTYLSDHIRYALSPPELHVRADTSWVSLGFYDPLETRSVDSLPLAVRTRLDSILDARVGTDFRKRLSFVHAVYADQSDSTFLAETHGVEWRVFEYRVGYSWRDPADRVRDYVGYVTLYPSGADTIGIEFPPVRQDSQLGHMVALGAARDTAVAHGVRPLWVRLVYDARRERLHYLLVGIGRSYGGRGSNPVAVVDAHSGKLVAISEYRWIS